jgi:hypothetical protein
MIHGSAALLLILVWKIEIAPGTAPAGEKAKGCDYCPQEKWSTAKHVVIPRHL